MNPELIQVNNREFVVNNLDASKLNIVKSHFTTSDEVCHISPDLKFPIAMRPVVKSALLSAGVVYIDNTYKYDGLDYFDISDRRFLTEEQYLIVKNIMIPKQRGIIQASTGFGKSYMIMYLIDAYHRKQSNAGHKTLVLTNSNSVKNTLLRRSKQLNIDLSNTFITNPIGLCLSNLFGTEQLDKFLNDVEFIQIDEFDSATASIIRILEKCHNVKIIYGYSATPIRKKNHDLTSYSVINKLDSNDYRILEISGFSIFYNPPSKKINHNIIKSTKFPKIIIPRYILDSEGEAWAFNKIKQYINECLLRNDYLFSIIDKYILPNKISTLFIPVQYIMLSTAIFEYYKKNHPDLFVIQWDSKKIRTTHPEVPFMTFQQLSDLFNYPEKFPNLPRPDIVTATLGVSGKGVDLYGIYDILLLCGSQFNTVTQVVGRLNRENLDLACNVWSIKDENSQCETYDKLFWSRFSKLKRDLKASTTWINDSDDNHGVEVVNE